MKTPITKPERCEHPNKKRCGVCGENYCPADGCDPYHVENCRDAMKMS